MPATHSVDVYGNDNRKQDNCKPITHLTLYNRQIQSGVPEATPEPLTVIRLESARRSLSGVADCRIQVGQFAAKSLEPAFLRLVGK